MARGVQDWVAEGDRSLAGHPVDQVLPHGEIGCRHCPPEVGPIGDVNLAGKRHGAADEISVEIGDTDVCVVCGFPHSRRQESVTGSAGSLAHCRQLGESGQHTVRLDGQPLITDGGGAGQLQPGLLGFVCPLAPLLFEGEQREQKRGDKGEQHKDQHADAQVHECLVHGSVDHSYAFPAVRVG